MSSTFRKSISQLQKIWFRTITRGCWCTQTFHNQRCWIDGAFQWRWYFNDSLLGKNIINNQLNLPDDCHLDESSSVKSTLCIYRFFFFFTIIIHPRTWGSAPLLTYLKLFTLICYFVYLSCSYSGHVKLKSNLKLRESIIFIFFIFIYLWIRFDKGITISNVT